MASLHLRSAGERIAAVDGRIVGASPLRFVVDSGLRAVVDARVEGVEVPMLVHANAGFVAMLTHEALRRVNGRRVAKETDFGLGNDLRLSESGRGHTEVSSLEVAGLTLSDQRIEVFDLPTENWWGMLGVDWLARSGAVVDFGRAQLFVPAAGGERESLQPQAAGGEDPVPLDRDAQTGRFGCPLSIEPAGRTVGRFVVSTCAGTTLDIEYARRHGIGFGAPVDEEHGPGGAVVATYRADGPVTLCSRGAPLVTVRPEIYDIYAYGQNARPAGHGLIAGYLGADVLAAHRGVVDFGG